MTSLLLRAATVALLLGAGACAKDPSAPGTDLGGDLAAPSDLGSARPLLGAQIDRVGRPLVETLLLDPFGLERTRDQQMADWNANGEPATWVGGFASRLASSLAAYDILDGRCGNQAAYSAIGGGADYATAGYLTLASALADDRLLLDTRQTSCTSYFAVESSALLMMAEKDCGGRAPGYDVADVMFGLLAGSSMPLSDNVLADSGRAPSADSFPFLADPE